MSSQASAILAAQIRTLFRFRRTGSGVGMLLSVFPVTAWYTLWILLAFAAMIFSSEPERALALQALLPRGLMLVLLYWQLTPILAASLGATLELKKLLVYPIPHGKLFGIEVLLRLTAGMEMLLLLTGIAAGLLRNSAIPARAAPAALALFVLFNLLVAAGLRTQLERWMARKRTREFIVLLVLLAAALPQLLLVTGVPASIRGVLRVGTGTYWPWTAAAVAALGGNFTGGLGVLLVWTLAAFLLGRWQFERGLRFDAAAARAQDRSRRGPNAWLDRCFRLPASLLADPLSAVVEKELRSLSRTPRFRLVFIMGFTFGIIVFLPIVLGHPQGSAAGFSGHYLTIVCAYALLLLGDVVFWNVFGFDRSATQAYFLLPAPLTRVLQGKNLAAGAYVLLEVTAIVLVWNVVRMPMTPGAVLEAYAVTLILAVYLMAAGNLSSVYYPRPVNPERSTGAGSPGRIRALLMLIYPVAAIPVMLAYGAEYAFNSQAAFWAVLGFAGVLGGVFYWVALDSGVATLTERRDKFLSALSESEGPISFN